MVLANCGHDEYGQSDWAGCIDGEWFGPCSEADCTGMCHYEGSCNCQGCPSPHCCRKELKR